MPWSAADAPRHTRKADTPEKRQRWAAIANQALAEGKSEAAAIKIANAAIGEHTGGVKRKFHRWI